MKTLCKACMAVTLISPLNAAQERTFEYGRSAELRNVTRFFLDTQGDMKRREQITKLLRRKLPNLSFTDRAEDAEAVIQYSEQLSVRLVNGTSINDRSCNAYVFVPIAVDKARLLFSYNMKKKNVFQKDPYKNFSEEFVKAYKEANADVSNNPYYRMMTGQDKKPDQ
ncbi:MAG: hypothetical protein ABR557_03015 [Pyrinomonadaceae bacterium]